MDIENRWNVVINIFNMLSVCIFMREGEEFLYSCLNSNLSKAYEFMNQILMMKCVKGKA